MTVFLPAQTPALDANGNPLPAASWGFTYRRTLTPADTDLGDLVTADSTGAFPEITLDVAIDYRAVLKNSAGQVVADIGAIVDSFFAPAVKRVGDTWKFYTTATTVPQSVYSDETLSIPLGAYVQANAAGRFPPIYLDGDVTYKAVLEDAAGATLATIDPVTFNNMWLYLNPGALIPVEPVEPSAGWNGTAGTGFGGIYGAVPTDPTRTTAKPVCRLMVPPNQYFTDELVVGVFAAANNGGSLLDNLGLEKVIVHYEGVATDLTYPSIHTFNDANGVSRSYLGWWITIKKPAATAGHANVYFEAVPADATMQNRVMGPYQFSPQTALHDQTLEVAATPAEIVGTRYKTLAAALTYCRTNAKHNPLITMTESGNYDLTTIGTAFNPNGYCTIEASVPVTITRPAAYTGGVSIYFRSACDGLHFRGSNITIDMLNMSYIYQEGSANRRHWLDGVTVTDSGGRYYLQRGLVKSAGGGNILLRNGGHLTECTISNINNPGNSCELVRGCTFSTTHNDVAVEARLFYGNTFHDHSSAQYRSQDSAMTIDGPAGATIELTGGPTANNRVLTAKVSGTTIGTFNILNTEAGWTANTNYTVQNVVDWVNSLGGGWSATLIDNARAACTLSLLNNVPFGGAFAATSCSSPLTLITTFDAHDDVWAPTAAVKENMAAVNNRGTEVYSQAIYASESGSSDILIAGNALHCTHPTDTMRFGSGTASHVVFAHNSVFGQNVVLRNDGSGYNPDGYCAFLNNVAPQITYAAAGSDPDVKIVNNHLMAGGTVPAGAGVSGTTIGGTGATLFVNAATGDFTPAGALLTNLKTPALARDRANATRAATDAAGAVAI